ncbi:MAG: OsmC family protein [Candidatus Kapabacteria bacterium]|nr:OsmC family protein [Candidatus Kapabacteria bacterium]
MDSHYYHVDVTWDSDRKGTLTSPELPQAIQVATPPEFPKGMPGIWSPEHYFTAAVSSCLMTTFLAIAEASNLEFVSFNCASKGKLEKIEGKFLMTEVLLEPMLILKNETDMAKAERILEKSEKACLISNSIKSTVSMKPTIAVAALV